MIHGCLYMCGKQSTVLPADTWDVCQERRPHRRSTLVSQFQCPVASVSRLLALGRLCCSFPDPFLECLLDKVLHTSLHPNRHTAWRM